MDRALMTDKELKLLKGLAYMCDQYLDMHRSGLLEHFHMGAGQYAIAVLLEYGLVETDPTGGWWTEAGLALLASE